MSVPELSVGGQVRPAARPLSGAAAAASRHPDLVWGVPTVVALVSALAWSWRPGYWTDEDATVSAVSRSGGQLVALLGRTDAVHAVYYLLLAPWAHLAGTSPFVLRLPSALAVAATAAGTALIGRRVTWSSSAGLAAGLVFAVLPVVAGTGMEARSTALGAAAATWSTWALLRALDGTARQPLGWVGYALLSALACAVHVYCVLLLVAHLVTLVTLAGGRRRGVTAGRAAPGAAPDVRGVLARWAAAAVVAVAAAAPVAWTGWSQRSQIGWLGRTTLRDLPGLATNLWFSGSVPVAVVAWALAVAGVVAWSRRPAVDRSPVDRPAARRPAGRRPVPGLLALAVPWAVVPPALTWLVSLREASAGSAWYSPRYLFFALPAFALVAGYGVTALAGLLPTGRRVAVVGLVAVLAVSGAGVQRQLRGPDGKGDDVLAVGRTIQAHRQPGDAVLYRPGTRRLAAIGDPAGFAGLVDIALAGTAVQAGALYGNSVDQATLTRRLATVDRVWVVDRPGRVKPGSDVTATNRALVAAGYRISVRYHPGLSELLLFVRRGSAAAR